MSANSFVLLPDNAEDRDENNQICKKDERNYYGNPSAGFFDQGIHMF
jgi:hypothetical protein